MLQRAMIAMAISHNPRILIADEATSNLDVTIQAEILTLVRELAGQGLGVLMISSELEEVVRCATRVTVLRDRRVVGELNAGEVDEQAIMHTIAQTGVKESRS